MNDNDFMKLAVEEAEKAHKNNEVPVGAVIVDKKNNILSKAHNQTIALSDPTGHAEILALRKACEKTSNYRLVDTILYVTLEPCIMCMGALIHARICRIVFGASDPKWGGAGSIYNIPKDGKLNHRPLITGGVCEKESRELMQNFFQAKRKSVASNDIMS